MTLCSSSRNKPKPAELKYSEKLKIKKSENSENVFIIVINFYIIIRPFPWAKAIQTCHSR